MRCKSGTDTFGFAGGLETGDSLLGSSGVMVLEVMTRREELLSDWVASYQ